MVVKEKKGASPPTLQIIDRGKWICSCKENEIFTSHRGYVTHPQVNSFVPPNLSQPYLGSLKPTWGQNFQSNAPFQGNIPNQPNPVGYLPQNPPQHNFSGLSNYLQNDYSPTSISIELSP
jgi:hypothetical protein